MEMFFSLKIIIKMIIQHQNLHWECPPPKKKKKKKKIVYRWLHNQHVMSQGELVYSLFISHWNTHTVLETACFVMIFVIIFVKQRWTAPAAEAHLHHWRSGFVYIWTADQYMYIIAKGWCLPPPPPPDVLPKIPCKIITCPCLRAGLSKLRN